LVVKVGVNMTYKEAMLKAKKFSKLRDKETFVYIHNDDGPWQFDYCTADDYYHGALMWIPEHWVAAFIAQDGTILEEYQV
jgi:hypothetical protein